MRIVGSTFKDYYDSVQAYGHDSYCQYLRRQKCFIKGRQNGDWLDPETRRSVDAPILVREFHRFAKQHWPSHSWTDSQGSHLLEYGLILVAGRLYPVVKATLRKDYSTISMHFDVAEVLRLLPDDTIFGQSKMEAKVKAFFSLRGSEVLMDWAIVHQVAAISYFDGRVTVNPRLADFELFRVLPPYQAAQELEMFLGNLAAPDRVPVVIADKHKVQAHGFDAYSFRKRPSS